MAKWEKARKRNLAGFALSIDALLATILVLGVLAFIGLGMQAEEISIARTTVMAKQAADDAFTALDNSGAIVRDLVDVECQNPAQCIVQRIQEGNLLPENTGLRVEVREYTPIDTPECRTVQEFGTCFSQVGVEEAGNPLPTSKGVIKGKKIAIVRSPGLDDETGQICRIIEEAEFQEEQKGGVALFQNGEPEKEVTTQVMVTNRSMEPLSQLECSEDPSNPTAAEIAVVTMKFRDTSRDPIALMMVMDKSGSMAEYDMGPQEISPADVITISDTPETKGSVECTVDTECEQTYSLYEVCNNSRCMMSECGGPSDVRYGTQLACNDQECANLDCGENETCDLTLAYPICIPEPGQPMCTMDSDCPDEDVFYCDSPGTDNARCEIRPEVSCFQNRINNCPHIDTVEEIKSDLDWEPITSFTVGNLVTDDVYLPDIDDGGRLVVVAEYAWNPFIIITPKLKLRGPDGTEYTNTSSNVESGEMSRSSHSIYIGKSVLSSNIGTWQVYGWSFIGWAGNDIWLVKENAGDPNAGYPYDRFVEEIAENVEVSGGTATGSGSECQDFQGWQEVATFEVPEDTYYWTVNFQYDAYPTAQECESRFQVLGPGESLGDGRVTTYSITYSGGSIYGHWASAALYGSLSSGSFPTGTYRVYYWSPVPQGNPQVIDVGYRVMTRVSQIADWFTDGRGRCRETDGKFRRYRIVADPLGNELNWNENALSFEVSPTAFSVNVPNLRLNGIYAEGWTDYYNGKFDTATHCRPLWTLNSPTGWTASYTSSHYPANSSHIFSIPSPAFFGQPPIELYGRGNYCINQYNVDGVRIPQCADWRAIYQTEPDGSPIDQGTWNVSFWSDEQAEVTMQWFLQRIDSAKIAAMRFIGREDWKEQDQFGLVSFNDQVLPADIVSIGSTKEDVLNALNELESSGGTTTALAIQEAAEELTISALDVKYLVLLTDGRANVCRSGPCTEAEAAADAIAAAEEARNEGIVVYVIGFADQGLIGAYEDVLKQIAKHERDDDEPPANSDYCNEDAIADPGEYCGKYYFAENEEVLGEIYSLIAGEIRERFGLVDIGFNLEEGIQLVDEANPGLFGVWDDSENGGDGGWATEIGQNPQDLPQPGTWNPETRFFWVEDKSIKYTGDYWFALQFEVVVPCSGSYCNLDYVVFPPLGTRVNDEEDMVRWAEETDPLDLYCDPVAEPLCQNKFLRIPFYYRDLRLRFVGGTLSGDGILLDLNIENIGYKDSDLANPPQNLRIEFTEALDGQETAIGTTDSCTIGSCSLTGSFGNQLNGSIGPDASEESLLLTGLLLCKTTPDAAECDIVNSDGREYDTHALVGGSFLDAQGTIVARINQDQAINECSENNEFRIYCGLPEFRFYAIEYYVWVD